MKLIIISIQNNLNPQKEVEGNKKVNYKMRLNKWYMNNKSIK